MHGLRLYACGSARYMEDIFDTARSRGRPDEAKHREFFSVAEAPPGQNLPFVLPLADGRRLEVPADRSESDLRIDAGVMVDLKCSDGLCGV